MTRGLVEKTKQNKQMEVKGAKQNAWDSNKEESQVKLWQQKLVCNDVSPICYHDRAKEVIGWKQEVRDVQPYDSGIFIT